MNNITRLRGWTRFLSSIIGVSVEIRSWGKPSSPRELRNSLMLPKYPELRQSDLYKWSSCGNCCNSDYCVILWSKYSLESLESFFRFKTVEKSSLILKIWKSVIFGPAKTKEKRVCVNDNFCLDIAIIVYSFESLSIVHC